MAGFLGNVINAIVGSEVFDVSHMSDSETAEFIRMGGGNTSISGRSVTESSAMNVAVAWRCINIISGVMSWIPTDVIKRVDEDTRKPAVGHPLRKLITVRPNGWQTPKQFRQMMQAHVILRGNAVAIKVRGVGRQVIALIPVHPDRVMIEQRTDLSVKYTITREDGSQKVYEQKDVFHLCGLSFNGFSGVSVLTHMRESIALALDSEAAASTLMKNGSFVDLVLQTDNKLSKEARENIATSWKTRHTGVSNSGSTPILEEGMKVAKVSMSANDLQFVAQRDFQRYDIATFLGVPPHMVGATEKTTSWGSGIESQGIGFVTYTLMDWIAMWEQSYKRDCLLEDDWETHDVRLFPQALLRGDTKAQWDAFSRGRQWGAYSPNDIRAMLDMNPRTLQNGEIDPKGFEYAEPPNSNPADATQEDDNEPDPQSTANR